MRSPFPPGLGPSSDRRPGQRPLSRTAAGLRTGPLAGSPASAGAGRWIGCLKGGPVVKNYFLACIGGRVWARDMLAWYADGMHDELIDRLRTTSTAKWHNDEVVRALLEVAAHTIQEITNTFEVFVQSVVTAAGFLGTEPNPYDPNDLRRLVDFIGDTSSEVTVRDGIANDLALIEGRLSSLRQAMREIAAKEALHPSVRHLADTIALNLSAQVEVPNG